MKKSEVIFEQLKTAKVIKEAFVKQYKEALNAVEVVSAEITQIGKQIRQAADAKEFDQMNKLECLYDIKNQKHLTLCKLAKIISLRIEIAEFCIVAIQSRYKCELAIEEAHEAEVLLFLKLKEYKELIEDYEKR